MGMGKNIEITQLKIFKFWFGFWKKTINSWEIRWVGICIKQQSNILFKH